MVSGSRDMPSTPTASTVRSLDIRLANPASPRATATPTCSNPRAIAPPLLAMRSAASAGSVADLKTTR